MRTYLIQSTNPEGFNTVHKLKALSLEGAKEKAKETLGENVQVTELRAIPKLK